MAALKAQYFAGVLKAQVDLGRGTLVVCFVPVAGAL